MSNTKLMEIFEDSFTAADMADAAAQGFRDGVASVQQPAAVDEAMVERAVAGYAAGPWSAFSPEASLEAHRDRMRSALAAALAATREAAEYMKAQVKWEHCDCGCPAAQTPADARSVTWLRAADMVRRAIACKEARND